MDVRRVRDLSRLMPVISVVIMLIGSSQCLVRHNMQKSIPQPDFTATEKTFPETQDFDHQILSFLRDNHYTGATIGVAHGDQVLYTQGYGQTDEGVLMRPTTLQPISSLSKTITAVAVLKLVEFGDLLLSNQVFGPDGILSSFQSLPNGTRTDPRLYDITVEHLLHHTGGWGQTRPRLYDPMMNSVYLSRGHDVVDIAKEMGLKHDLTPNDIISYMIGQPLDHAPGIKFEYSNFGYSVLGRVIETVSGISYASFVRSQVLEPLGMWRTRIGPHRLTRTGHNNHIPAVTFSEGSIPLIDDANSNVTPMSYNLFDSSLGWWSTTYDLMRFITGLTSGMVLNSESLKLLTKHPDSPVSEHRDTWHGLGVHVNNDQAWWQKGDTHNNEIMLFHQESQPSSKSRKFGRKPKTDSWSWIVILSDNNRKNLQQIFSQLMSSVTQWPSDNLLIEDCGEYLARGSWKHSTLMNSKIEENQFPLLISAVSRLHYYSVWISAYNVNQKTYFSVVFKKDKNLDTDGIVQGLTKTELLDVSTTSVSEGYYLKFVTSYNSFRYNGRIRFTAIFSQTPPSNTSFQIGESWTDFSASLNEKNYMPSTQSVTSFNGVRLFTYSLNEKKLHSWTSYHNLTLEQLELQIRTNANVDRVLEYLDSYTHHGQVLFSAIFSPGKSFKWQVQTNVRHSELARQSFMFRGLRFKPRIIVGYECKGQPCFVIMWKKN